MRKYVINTIFMIDLLDDHVFRFSFCLASQRCVQHQSSFRCCHVVTNLHLPNTDTFFIFCKSPKVWCWVLPFWWGRWCAPTPSQSWSRATCWIPWGCWRWLVLPVIQQLSHDIQQLLSMWYCCCRAILFWHTWLVRNLRSGSSSPSPPRWRRSSGMLWINTWIMGVSLALCLLTSFTLVWPCRGIKTWSGLRGRASVKSGMNIILHWLTSWRMWNKHPLQSGVSQVVKYCRIHFHGNPDKHSRHCCSPTSSQTHYTSNNAKVAVKSEWPVLDSQAENASQNLLALKDWDRSHHLRRTDHSAKHLTPSAPRPTWWNACSTQFPHSNDGHCWNFSISFSSVCTWSKCNRNRTCTSCMWLPGKINKLNRSAPLV